MPKTYVPSRQGSGPQESSGNYRKTQQAKRKKYYKVSRGGIRL